MRWWTTLHSGMVLVLYSTNRTISNPSIRTYLKPHIRKRSNPLKKKQLSMILISVCIVFLSFQNPNSMIFVNTMNQDVTYRQWLSFSLSVQKHHWKENNSQEYSSWYIIKGLISDMKRMYNTRYWKYIKSTTFVYYGFCHLYRWLSQTTRFSFIHTLTMTYKEHYNRLYSLSI